MVYEIETGIDIPKRTNVGASKYPWELMDTNESFLVPNGNVKSLRTVAYAAGKRLNMKFTARQVDDGVRVWRVA